MISKVMRIFQLKTDEHLTGSLYFLLSNSKKKLYVDNNKKYTAHIR